MTAPVYRNALEMIGNTPMLRLERVANLPRVEILAKAEWANPGGSVKDRAAAWIVREAIDSGKLSSANLDVFETEPLPE